MTPADIISKYVGAEQYAQWELEHGAPLRWTRYKETSRPAHQGYQTRLRGGDWVCVLVPKRGRLKP